MTCKPSKSTPRKYSNFSELLAKFQMKPPPTQSMKVSGKKSLKPIVHKLNKKFLKQQVDQTSPDVKQMRSRLPNKENECTTKTRNVFFIESNSVETSFKSLKTLTPAPKNPLNSLAMGKMKTQEKLERKANCLTSQARPALSKPMISAANINT